MAIHRTDRGSCRPSGLVILGFVLFVLPILPAVGQNLPLTFEIGNNPVGVKDRIFLTITVKHSEASDVLVTPPKWPEGFVLLSGPRIRPYADDQDSNFPQKVRITYTLRSDIPGRFILKGFSVQAGAKRAKTAPVLLEVGLYKNRQVYMPLEVVWQVPETPLYVGAAIPVYLVLKDQVEIPLVESFEVTKPQGGLFEEAQGIGEIRISKSGDIELYTVPVASYLLTPSQSGRLFLPSAKVNALGLQAETGTVRLEIEKLPDEITESGAIGNFHFTHTLDGTRLTRGEEVTLLLRIEGTGNLHYLEFPVPDFGNLMQIDTSEKMDIFATSIGYSGYREKQYVVVSEIAGSTAITIPDFVWLDYTTGSVRRTGEARLAVATVSADEPVLPDGQQFPFAPGSLSALLELKPSKAHRVPLNYLWMLPAPIAFIILLALKRTKILFVSVVFVFLGAGDTVGNGEVVLKEALEAYHSDNMDIAAERFKESLGHFPDNPGILYALSLSAYRDGDYAESLHYARRAIRVRPMYQRYRDFMSWLNGELQLDKPVSPALKMHPDVFFYLMISFSVLAFVFLSIQLFRNRGVYIILFILCALFTVGSCAALIYTTSANRIKSGVVSTAQSPMKKIPSDMATDWMSLPVGQSVTIIDRNNSYYLVKTSLGLKGWLSSESVLLDEGREYR